MSKPVKYGDVIALQYNDPGWADSITNWLGAWTGDAGRATCPGIDHAADPDWSKCTGERWIIWGKDKAVGTDVKYGDMVALQYNDPGLAASSTNWLGASNGKAGRGTCSGIDHTADPGWSKCPGERWMIWGKGKTVGQTVEHRDLIALQWRSVSSWGVPLTGLWLGAAGGFAGTASCPGVDHTADPDWSKCTGERWIVWAKRYTDRERCLSAVGATTAECRDIITGTCRDMEGQCKNYIQTHPGEFDALVAAWCPSHLDDPFCSCYRPLPADAPVEVQQVSAKPQCWNATCNMSGYKNTNLKGDTAPCPDITVCTLNSNQQNNTASLSAGNIIKQDCSRSTTTEGVTTTVEPTRQTTNLTGDGSGSTVVAGDRVVPAQPATSATSDTLIDGVPNTVLFVFVLVLMAAVVGMGLLSTPPSYPSYPSYPQYPSAQQYAPYSGAPAYYQN